MVKRLAFVISLLFLFIHSEYLYSQPNAKRKTVAVVLSGGGAKGMAHIGALEVIKKVGIPVDFYVGTSMGSIIGGLSAIGYTPEQLDSMVKKQNWQLLLSDKIPRADQNMEEREAAEKYFISLPFGPSMKLRPGGGLIKGQNLSNLFSELTIGYHDSIDFNKLPVPFACVSDNIATGKEVDFHSGILSQAMRASMAIPAVFTPVRIDSMVLIDGGVINNYPVNVAKKMGADIVIGVDVQSELKGASELTSASSIIGQLVNLMGEDLYKKNLKETNTVIKVNVEGYSAASFTPNAIDTLIQRGKEAAMSQIDALYALKKELGLDSTFIPTPPPAYPYTTDRKVFVNKIIFDGNKVKEKKWLLRECDLKEHSELSIRQIERTTALLCSNMGYANATFSLPESEDGNYNLVFTLTKKHENMLNVGFRFDSEEVASILINVINNFNTKIPSSLSLTGRLGKRYEARIDYSLEPSPLKRWNMAYMFKYNNLDYYHYGDRTHNTTCRYHMAEVSFTDVWFRNLKFSVGARYELYDYDKALSSDATINYNIKTEHFFDYFAKLHYDNLDKPYFPAKGFSARGSYILYTDNFFQYDDNTPFSAIEGTFESVISVSNRFKILPFIGGRFLIGDNIPFSQLNMMGGDVIARFLPQQLPFAGINNIEVMDNSLLIGSLKFRQRMGGIHYLSLTTNYAFSGNKVKNMFNSDTMWGCGVGYGIDSMFGPLEASLNYANHADKFNFYINLGFKF